jgi:xanthine dehydrogenase accessory factor
MSGAADDWLAALQTLRAQGVPCVLATLVAVKGSTPRPHGTKMVVTRDSLVGSIGGGHLEHSATERARAMLAAGESAPKLETYSLGAHLGQCCGGKVSVLLEPFAPSDFAIAIFGAGHVGRALVDVLAGLPARIRWIDSRAEQFPAAPPPNVEKIVADFPADEVKDLPPDSFALVMTHSHDLDLALCEALLRRGDCRYLGVIGSATKWRRFESRLIDKGFAPERVRAIRCPIGIEGISGKHPREIAIAVAAELLRVREAADAANAVETAAG